MELEIKLFEEADETRVFEKGTFEVVTVGGMTIGRARYEPGWKWSEHNGPTPGHDSWVIGDEPYVSIHFLGPPSTPRARLREVA